ncbi:MAG: amidohydrolase [Chloroflexi bacterium]|nr:amidohydrolase [Chloroflexota bacterium]
MTTEARSPFISVDDHVQETPDVWTTRMSTRRWGDRIPHTEEQPDGTERWVVDGQPVDLDGVGIAGALMPDRAQEPQRWEDVPAPAYQPAQRLRVMQADGVDYSALYPMVAGVGGGTFGRINDAEFEQDCVRAYNDWLIEEWAACSDRFIPQCIVPLYPVDAIVAEIRRAVAKGHRGVVYPAHPMFIRDLPHVANPEFEPVWSTCEELGVPLCLHAGSSPPRRAPIEAGMSGGRAKALASLIRPTTSALYVGTVLLSKVLPRHPKLKVIFAESALGWGAGLLELADHHFHVNHADLEGYDHTPTEMFKPQCYFTGWYEPVRVHAPYIGVDNILWSTNFPLATSTWPATARYLDECFQGVSDADRRRILWSNAAALYGIEQPVAAPAK